MATPLAVRYVEHELVVYRRTWRSSVASSFLAPILFLAAIGGTLGRSIDRHGVAHLSGVGYLVWLAPGLLASNAMQVGVNDCLHPVLAGFKWVRFYVAAAATPLRPGDIVTGHLCWVAIRLTLVSAAYVLVAAIAGAASSAWIIAAVPAAVITGLAFAAPIAAWSATREQDQSFVAIQRFGVLPLFLFSGTFFPIDQLPAVVRPIAYISPLWHGVSICRAVALGHVGTAALAGHLAVLVSMIVTGGWLARRMFERRLST
ncbi:MAG: ABC transporter permease [Acidimicrobiales bacterium]